MNRLHDLHYSSSCLDPYPTLENSTEIKKYQNLQKSLYLFNSKLKLSDLIELNIHKPRNGCKFYQSRIEIKYLQCDKSYKWTDITNDQDWNQIILTKSLPPICTDK